MVKRVRFTQKEQDDISVVACHRVADLRSPHVPSMIVACSKCQAPIWRAENSPTKPPAMCIQCIRRTVTAVGSNPLLDELLDAAVKRKR